MRINRATLSLAFGLSGLAAAYGEANVPFDNGFSITSVIETLGQIPAAVSPEPAATTATPNKGAGAPCGLTPGSSACGTVDGIRYQQGVNGPRLNIDDLKSSANRDLNGAARAIPSCEGWMSEGDMARAANSGLITHAVYKEFMRVAANARWEARMNPARKALEGLIQDWGVMQRDYLGDHDAAKLAAALRAGRQARKRSINIHLVDLDAVFTLNLNSNGLYTVVGMRLDP